MSEVENALSPAQPPQKGFFGKLINGDLGLAKTFWLYGVVLELVVMTFLRPKPYLSLFIALMFINDAYLVVLMMGIWRAANKYKGLSIWAWLSKIAVGLFALSMLVGILMVIFTFTALSLTGRS